MDQKDRQILRILQSDAGLSMSELAERCTLSKTAVWRRVRELETAGVIQRRITILDAAALGFGLTVYAIVRSNQHSDAWFAKFEKAVKRIPEILEFHRTSGDIDYLLRIVATDIAHYDKIYKALIRDVDFADISSTFVMETIKATSELPI
ncbi:MAG: Lrp/AsnC family transcriptional regulator [Pseudomonadota bacterium]